MWALEHSSTSAASANNTTTTLTYNLPRTLHLYNETRRHFLPRFQAQLMREAANVAYISDDANSPDGGPEWLARYRERFAPLWWLTEHDVEEEFRRTAEAEDLLDEIVGKS